MLFMEPVASSARACTDTVTAAEMSGPGEVWRHTPTGFGGPMRRLLFVVLLLVVCSPSVLAKDRAWTTGTLVNADTERDTRTVGIPPTIVTGPKAVTMRNDVTFYTIDDGKYLWVVSRRMTKKDDQPLKLTIDAPVKFAIEKKTCYLLDEQGEEHKLAVERKRPKLD